MDYHRLKRVFDIMGAAVVLFLLGPLMLVIAGLVFAFHGAPVIFKQERVTLGGRVFLMRKFRSMRTVDPDHGRVRDEDRLTRFGRLLRATSCDELPSLWNVLTGDMSFIGPRPLTTDYLSLYTPEQLKRHEVRGGLSGLAQISGRNALSWDDRFDLDIAYVETMGLRTDLKILLHTVIAVARQEGVSHPGSLTMFSFGGSLRSSLVDFKQIAGTRELTQWMVRTRSGERVGLCELAALAPGSTTVRFIPHADPLIGGPSDEIGLEVLRLLLNRARGTDADVAYYPVSSTSESTALLLSSGFRPVTGEGTPILSLSGLGPDLRGQVLRCDLWPEVTSLREVGLAS